MDLHTVARVLSSHRRLAALVAISGIVAAVLLGQRVEPAYQARATLLMLSPAETLDSQGKSVEVNPFARAGQAERLLSSAAIVVSGSKRFAGEMARAGADGAFSFVLTSEVLVDVTATASTSDMAQRTLESAVVQFAREVRDMQQGAGASEGNLIDVEIIAATPVPEALLGGRARLMAVVGLLGLVASVGAAFAAEALGPVVARRRTARLSGAGGDEADVTRSDAADLPPAARLEPVPTARARPDDADRGVAAARSITVEHR